MTCTMENLTDRQTRVLAERTELKELGQRICLGAGHLAASTGAWLGLVEEFDRRGGWAVDGINSCAHWLSWKCGMGMVAARQHVRVARALVEFPLIGAELRSGRLSYSKARALTRVATAATEEHLVEIARSCTGSQLEDLVAGLRKAQDLDDVNARHQARHLTTSWAENGSLLIRGRLSPEDGAVFLAALQAARDATEPTPTPAAADGGHDSAESPCGPASKLYTRRIAGHADADALVAMAETLLASGPKPAPGGERYQASIHLNLDDLLAQHVQHAHAQHGHAHRTARIDRGPQLHPETARRITCDCTTDIVAHHRAGKPGTSMDVGRRTRVIPARLRRALFLRDHGCRFPGCTQKRFVDGHHVKHWSRRGPTALHNLILLCRQHHRLVHEGGFGLEADGRGSFTFRRPDGTVIPETRPTRR